ncbi:MAG: DUF1294 domain-containing protein [Ruminococcaceae bacterium]|nr:DUF1294 domain-containing protein [Oscillospiraceae bacterium]
MKFLIIYLILINIITFIVFGADKLKAVKNKWRVPESVLLGLSLAGGSVGGIFGMYIFRHKTRKIAFKLLIPLFCIVHIILVYLLIR